METLPKTCKSCGVLFNKLPKTTYQKWSRQFCCSKSCAAKHRGSPWLEKFKIKKGQHLSATTQFVRGGFTGATNNRWKGDKAGYTAKHDWIKNHFGKPQFCEHCKSSAHRMYHWANISKEHKRNRNDWLRLCVPCHKKYDSRPQS